MSNSQNLQKLQYGSVTIIKNPARGGVVDAGKKQSRKHHNSPNLFDIASIRERKNSKQHKKHSPSSSGLASVKEGESVEGDNIEDELDSELSQFVPMSPFSMTPTFNALPMFTNQAQVCTSPTVFVDYDDLQNMLYQQTLYYLTYTAAQQGIMYVPNVTNIVYTNSSVSPSFDNAFDDDLRGVMHSPYEQCLVDELNSMEFNEEVIANKPDVQQVHIASPTPDVNEESKGKKVQIKTKMNKQEFFKFMTKVSHAVSSAVERQDGDKKSC